MKKKENLLKKEAVQAEQWTGAHLVMVGVYTAFSILLIIFTLLLSAYRHYFCMVYSY